MLQFCMAFGVDCYTAVTFEMTHQYGKQMTLSVEYVRVCMASGVDFRGFIENIAVFLMKK